MHVIMNSLFYIVLLFRLILHHGIFTLITLHSRCIYVDWSKLSGLVEELANGICIEGLLYSWFSWPWSDQGRYLRGGESHRGCGRLIIWMSSLSCWPRCAMSCICNMKRWIHTLYSFILKSCKESRVRLLDMRYLSNCSESNDWRLIRSDLVVEYWLDH